MSDEPGTLYKFGGISFIISGSLFFLKYVFDLMTGPPPSKGADIVAWTASKK